MVASAAKYLGLYVGPGRGTLSWQAPLRKYLDRAKLWGKLGFGLLLTLQAYQVYVSSVLQFVAQLEDLPPDFLDYERKAVQALFPGPTGWMTPGCLKDLKYLHLPKALTDVAAIAPAAKARVVRFENAADGGLDIQARAHRLRELPQDGCSLAHMGWWMTWAKRSFIINLSTAHTDSCQQIRGRENIVGDLQTREGWQGRVAKVFSSVTIGHSTLHLRRRLDRWKLVTLPGHRVGKVERVLEVLSRLSTPRVQASYLRMVCNGWCTRRRYQQTGLCFFGCGEGEDSLEHIATCRKVGELFSTHLGLHVARGHGALDEFLCMTSNSDPMLAGGRNPQLFDSYLVRRALGCYAVYRIHNGRRYGNFQTEDVSGAFERLIREGAR